MYIFCDKRLKFALLSYALNKSLLPMLISCWGHRLKMDGRCTLNKASLFFLLHFIKRTVVPSASQIFQYSFTFNFAQPFYLFCHLNIFIYHRFWQCNCFPFTQNLIYLITIVSKYVMLPMDASSFFIQIWTEFCVTWHDVCQDVSYLSWPLLHCLHKGLP